MPLTANSTLEDIIAEQCFEPQEFSCATELLITYHPAIQAEQVMPYKWQVEVSEQLCASDRFSKFAPLKYYLVAANGSGKDAYVISPFAVWFAFTKIRSRCIITSSSHSQLSNQTESYIRTWCNMINNAHKGDPRGLPFIVKKQHIDCRWTGSEIILFATDEEGKAEGYHPHADYPLGELAVIINEGKSVRDGIFMALNRCTYTHWVVVSSPGKDSGNLYQSFKKAIQFPEELPEKGGVKYARKITAYDCPHIGEARIESEKQEFGANHPWFRSARLAEFTSDNEEVIISLDSMRRCQEQCVQYIPYGLRAGLDLALGGDETTFYVFDGNKYKAKEIFKIGEARATVQLCISFFEKHGFTKKTAGSIVADHGGIGAGLRALFEELGWSLTWVSNQSKALRPQGYCANRGAELWMNMKSIIEQGLVFLPDEEDDPKFWSQVGSRYYTTHKISGKLVLESKAEAKAKGHGSPDRADAFVLAFNGLTAEEIRHQAMVLSGKIQISKLPTKMGKPISAKAIAKQYDEQRYANAFPEHRQTEGKKLARTRGSYSIIARKTHEIWPMQTQQTSLRSAKQKNTIQIYSAIGKSK